MCIESTPSAISKARKAKPKPKADLRRKSGEQWRKHKVAERTKLERAYKPALEDWFEQFAVAALKDAKPQIEAAVRTKKVSAIKKIDADRYIVSRYNAIRGRILVRKDIEVGPLERSLKEIFRRFGLASYEESAKDTARATGTRWVMRPQIAAEINDAIDNKVVLLVKETEQRVRESVRRIVSDALREDPVPTSREIGRRIARQWMGPPSARSVRGNRVWPGRGTTEEQRVTADWARDQAELKQGGKEHLFSFARAQTIARTEIAQAQNAAIADGMTQAGIQLVSWLPRPFNPDHDKPGARNHYLMDDHPPISVKAMNGTDKSKWFLLPPRKGATGQERAPYPNWIGLEAGQTVNCQCVLVPER